MVAEHDTRLDTRPLIGIGLVCLADSAFLVWLHKPLAADYWESAVALRVASLALATSAFLVLLASYDALRRSTPRLRRRTPRREREQEAAAPEAATGDSAPRAAGDGETGLPVMAVPHVRPTVRDSVIAFAQRHSLRPFEDDSGFVLADRQGNYYRASIC